MHIHTLKRVTRYLLLWSLFITALLLSAVRIFLSDISSYKPLLEAKISQATALPVHIGRLKQQMHFFSPGIALQDISIDALDVNTPPAVQLKEIHITLDLPAMLWTGDILASTKVTLIGARFAVERNADGVIAIKGFKSSDYQPLWILQGKQYEILQSQISWQDLQHPVGQINFSNVDLSLVNLGQAHEIHLRAKLPEEYGDTIRMSARLQGNLLATDDIQGQLYVEGAGINATRLVNDELPANYRLESGVADFQLWGQLQKGVPTQLTSHLQAQQVKISNTNGHQVQLDIIQGYAGWINQQGNTRISGYDIDVVAGDKEWLDAEFYLQHNQQGDWSGLVKKLDLQLLSYLAPALLPQHDEYSQWLSANLVGQITDLRFYANADMQHYALQGRFAELGTEPINAIPKIQGLSGYIQGSDSQGRLTFTSANASLEAANIFRNKLPIQAFKGVIDWYQQQDSWQISSRNLVLQSPDFQTETDFDLVIPKNHSSPTLELYTWFGNIPDISRVPYYYPAKVMDKDALSWLDQAFLAGQVRNGQIMVKGALDQFPFKNGQGLFEIVGTIENGGLQYHPDWPHVQDITANVHYLGQNLHVAIDTGTSEDVHIKQLLVTINALPDSERAYVNGQVDSQLQNALQFLSKTPLRSQVEPLIKLTHLENNTQVDVDLAIPYHANMAFGVNVNAHVDNARLLFKPIDLLFDHISGTLHFTEDKIASTPLSATLLGLPIHGVLTTDNNVIRLQAEGTANMGALQQKFPFLSGQPAHGEFPLQAELVTSMTANRSQTLTINSDLRGLVIDTQDMLAKTAEEQRQLQLVFQFDNKDLLPVQLHYGAELNAALLMNVTQNYLYSGNIAVGSHHNMEFRQQGGLQIDIKQPEFKLSQAFGAASQEKGAFPPLQEVNLETENLIWQGQNFGAINCQLLHEDQSWHARITSAMGKGKLVVPDHLDGDSAIKLDMDYLNLSAMHSLNFDAAEGAIENLPLINIDSKQLLWRNVDLGKLKLQTERRLNGIHFKQIKISDANKNIDFNADWIKLAHGSSTLISGGLTMDGFGAFLSGLGFSDDFKETHAELNFTGGWSNTPQQFSLQKLHGHLQVMLADGRISSIEPGFGRLLGLISMAQWAKRLSLDFTDLYREGLAFNKITGDFKISDGNATTDNLLIDAVAAKMKISGTVNLLEKTLDHRVLVLPKSSDAVPIAGTIVGGVAEIITNAVTNDYQEGYFFGSEYKIDGHWGSIAVTPQNDHNGLVNKTWHGLTDFGWLKKRD